MIGRGTASKVAANVIGRKVLGAMASSSPVRDAALAGGAAYTDAYTAARRQIEAARAQKAAQAVPSGGGIPHVIYTEIEPGKTQVLQQHEYTTDVFNPAVKQATQEHGDYDAALEAMTKKVAGSGLAEKLTQAARSAGSTLTVNSVEPLNGAYRTADGILKARPNVQIAFTGTPEDGKELVQGVTRGAAQEGSIAFRPLTPDEILAGVSGDPEYNLRLPTTLSRDEQTDVANALANIPELQINGKSIIDGDTAQYNRETGDFSIFHSQKFAGDVSPEDWVGMIDQNRGKILSTLDDLDIKGATDSFRNDRRADYYDNTYAGGESQTPEGPGGGKASERELPPSGNAFRGGGSLRQAFEDAYAEHLRETLGLPEEFGQTRTIGPSPPTRPPVTGPASGNTPGANSSPGE